MSGNRVELLPLTRQDVQGMIEAMSGAERAEVSAQWLAQLDAVDERDPWAFGFSIVLSAGKKEVGTCGFKGPPANGCVEIAYRIEEAHCGQGYATEAAQALTTYALKHSDVQLVRAHTLPERNASTRVLTKCGFQFLGPVIEPEDGLVWRWEKSRID